MKEALYCQSCNAFLGSVDLKRLVHVEIACPECGEWNVFDYDPGAYVFKSLERDD